MIVGKLVWLQEEVRNEDISIARETCAISDPTIHLWHESQKEFGAQFIVIFFGNSQRSLLSPTVSVKSTSPDTENHDKNGYAKFYDDNNLFMTNVDNSDTTYTNKHKNTKYNVRNMDE